MLTPLFRYFATRYFATHYFAFTLSPVALWIPAPAAL